MSTSSTRRLFAQAVLVALSSATGSCVTPIRVPLAVPLAAVGGSRPATPQGLQLIAEFGDGVWGQEQERAEIAGLGFGISLRDRVELNTSVYGSTREVRDTNGNTHLGEDIFGVRGKVRLGDLREGRASFGLHLAHVSTQRENSAQDERLTGFDIALPLTVYPWDLEFGGADYRWGVYAAPRLVLQTFEDRSVRETTKGTLAAALVGIAARWRYVAVTGELNFARTPSMTFRQVTFQGGWHLLPMVSVRGMIPFGD